METKLLAEYISGFAFDKLSRDAVQQAKLCLLDLIGVALGAQKLNQANIWKAYFLRDVSTPETATAWTPDLLETQYIAAAGLNAALGHMLDMDDVHNASIIHLGVVTIPAALATAQRLGLGGRALITAIAAGYEAGARVGEAINPGSYRHWHTTGVAGAFCSAAAVGQLLSLDSDQMLNAFGSAGTQAAGLWEFLTDGAMSKPLHVANATICGMRSAELARLGVTGAQRILEGSRGFIKALTNEYSLDAITRDMDYRRYKILENSFKPYACCRHTHSANYAIFRILAREDMDIEEIDHITDRTYQVAIDTAQNASPQTLYAHKFSIEYCIAAALIHKNLYEEAFSQESIHDRRIKPLMDKVRVVHDPDVEKEYQRDSTQWTHIVEITMKDGRVITERVDFPLGDFKNPISLKQFEDKFLTMAEGLMPEERSRALIGRIMRLEELEDANQLFCNYSD